MAEVVVTALAVLLASLFLGAPVMAAIGFTGIVTMLVFMGGKFLIQFASIAYSQGTSMNQLVAPLFIMMAEFLARGGIAEDIYSVLNRFLRQFSKQMFIDTMKATAKTGTMIIFLVIAGFCLSFVLSYVGVATRLAEMIVASGTNRWIVMILLYILWFILGCLMDPASMVILTIPFIYPTLTKLGFDPIWVGIVSTLCVEIGMITPPVGLNLFVLRAVTPVEMRHIIRGSLPYVLVLLTGLVILNIFPGLALMIPK